MICTICKTKETKSDDEEVCVDCEEDLYDQLYYQDSIEEVN